MLKNINRGTSSPIGPIDTQIKTMATIIMNGKETMYPMNKKRKKIFYKSTVTKFIILPGSKYFFDDVESLFIFSKIA